MWIAFEQVVAFSASFGMLTLVVAAPKNVIQVWCAVHHSVPVLLTLMKHTTLTPVHPSGLINMGVVATEEAASAPKKESFRFQNAVSARAIVQFADVSDYPSPFKPTCASSATRALWLWRQDCDRFAGQRLNPRCWNRAPSVDRCCADAAPSSALKGRAGDDETLPPDANTATLGAPEIGNQVIRQGAPASCKLFWPSTRGQEFMCCGVEAGKVGKMDEKFGWCDNNDGRLVNFWGLPKGRDPPGLKKYTACQCTERNCKG
jgi:hypothetical protein